MKKAEWNLLFDADAANFSGLPFWNCDVGSFFV